MRTVVLTLIYSFLATNLLFSQTVADSDKSDKSKSRNNQNKGIKSFMDNLMKDKEEELEKNNDITLIASSPETKYQIFKYKNHAYGIQFHIEIKKTTVSEWGCVPEYKSALEKQLGKGALDKFDKDSQTHMSSMNEYSKILYENFKKLVQ